jgi:hypothetical protein
MKNELLKLVRTYGWLGYIYGLSYLLSKLLDFDYWNVVLIVGLVTIVQMVIEVKSNNNHQSLDEAYKKDMKRLEEKFKRDLDFEINSRIIGDNLSRIKAGNVKLDVIDNTYRIKLLENEINKLKDRTAQ